MKRTPEPSQTAAPGGGLFLAIVGHGHAESATPVPRRRRVGEGKSDTVAPHRRIIQAVEMHPKGRVLHQVPPVFFIILGHLELATP